MNATQIFCRFCKFIDDRIFSEENYGSTVAFVVDKSLINEFCKKNEIREKDLMDAVFDNLYSYNRNISHIKGILAIQLYAASKRSNSGGITVRNYRDRLSQVLDWDMNDLQRWMEEHQENFWESFYSWCDSHFFFVAKCKRKTGAGRYVQYPILQSQCVFTEEDLKYIAYAFVDNNLQVGEDLSEREFWRNINKYSLLTYFRTKHARDVRENSRTDDDYLRQIFNYYLRWDGEYETGYNSSDKKQDIKEKDEFLYLTDNLGKLQFRHADLTLIKSVEISKLYYSTFSRIFPFKHKGMILFKKDDVYENYWQECRYLEEGEEGIAVVFTKQCSHRITQRSELLLKMLANVAIYKVVDSLATHDLYTTKRFYSLEGGLKVGRSSYLLGAGPILKLTKKSRFWIDGVMRESKNEEAFDLSGLGEGSHTVRFPNYKSLVFEMVLHEALHPKWLDNYNKWDLDLKSSCWDSVKKDKGIVGLDFSIIPQHVQGNAQGSVLQRWGRMQLFGTIQNNETNNAIKILSKIK